jgi:N-acetylmuramoyl-L-alanine amidase
VKYSYLSQGRKIMRKKSLPMSRFIFALALVVYLIPSSQAADLKGRIVCIDPGHQLHADNSPDPIGPGSSETKPCVSSGTSGSVSGPEHAVVLDVGLRLRDILTSQGITVVMTRTTSDVLVCNSERATIANKAKADLCIRLHCDAGSAHSCFTLYPGLITGWTDDIYAESLKAAGIIQKAYSATTGIPDGGLTPRTDLTGFNWSDVPVVLPEMLKMQNAQDDILASTPEFRQKMAEGCAKGIIEYLNTLPPRAATPSGLTLK